MTAMDDTTSTSPNPDRDEVEVRVGPTAASQESEFMNATLQFNGTDTVAYSIATYLAVPDGDVEATAETLRAALAAAAGAVPGLRFVVEVGPIDD